MKLGFCSDMEVNRTLKILDSVVSRNNPVASTNLGPLATLLKWNPGKFLSIFDVFRALDENYFHLTQTAIICTRYCDFGKAGYLGDIIAMGSFVQISRPRHFAMNLCDIGFFFA